MTVEEEPGPARTSGWGWVIIVAAVLVLAAGAYVALRPGGDDAATGGSSTAGASTMGPPAPSTPPSTEPPPPADSVDGLDWISGIADLGVAGSDGSLLVEVPFSLSWDKRAAWDGGDGFAYVGDDRTLWWARPDGTEAVLDLADIDFLWALVDVVEADAGPVAILRDPRASASPDGLRWVTLETGEDVAPVDGRVDTPTSEWLAIRLGAQGRWAGIDQPNWSGVEMSPEGMPVPPYPLPELVVTDDAGAELARIELGTFDAPIATLHDFDGRRLIVSVEALEPASGARTVYLVDLECADCTEVWQAEGPDSFDLVGMLSTEGAVVVTALD